MDAKLVMFKPDGTPRELSISSEVSTIGRGKECTFRIPLVDVSRKHCELTLGEGELRVRDLASSNGTFVNDRRINETTLHAGDDLAIGPVKFTVQIDGEPADIAPPGANAQAAEATSAADDEDVIIELEPDEVADLSEVAEESDPIAALEALADLSKEEDEKK